MAARLRTPVPTVAPPPSLPDVPLAPSSERLKVACAGVMAQVPTVKFGHEVEELLGRASQLTHRPRFLWCWCARGIERVTLSSVPEALLPWLRDTKVLAVALSQLLDDLVDPRAASERFEQAVGLLDWPAGSDLPWELEEAAHDQLALIRDLWSALGRRARELTGWERWSELFLYDWRQLVHALRYQRLVRSCPELTNLAEDRSRSPHAMAMMAFATLDWMASPLPDREELGSLREAMAHVQLMGRLGTGLATWRRQLAAQDISGAVMARAREMGVVTAAELRAAGEAGAAEGAGAGLEAMAGLIARVERGGVEERVLAEWQEHHRRLEALAARVQSVDLTALTEGTDVLLGMSLAAAGRL
jgi:hypothetical protein